jgi:hypothetical protein
MTTIGRAAGAALVLVLATAATASAAPGATTGGTSALSANGVRLHGSVDPNNQPTSYYFEYGTTRRYGSRTGDSAAGNGGSPRNVSAEVGGLAPNTVYHYRIVASNPTGVTSGADRTFRTRPQPLGLNISATPNPVVFGSPTTITGTLTGTGNAGKQVVLQQRAFPYTTGFANVGNPIVTDAAGNFAFPLLSVPATTQYRVVATEGRDVVSPILTLGVAVSVKTNVSTTRVTRGRSVRFSGTIRPARAGAQWAIQKETRDGRWVTVAGSITRGGSSSFSGFSRRVRIPRGGNYRVFVLIVDGNLTSGIGRTVRISTRR